MSCYEAAVATSNAIVRATARARKVTHSRTWPDVELVELARKKEEVLSR